MNFIGNGHYQRTFYIGLHLLSGPSHAYARTLLGHVPKWKKHKIYQRRTNKNSKQRNGHRHSSCRRRLGSCIFEDYFCDLCVFSIHTMTWMCNKLTFLLFHLTCRDIYGFVCVRRRSNHFFFLSLTLSLYANDYSYQPLWLLLPQLRRLVRLPKTNIMLHQIDSAINLEYKLSAAVCSLQSFSPRRHM